MTGMRNGQQWGGQPYQQNTMNTPAPITPKNVPADYVGAAEKVMQKVATSIKTSKLRGFLTLVIDIYNAESLRKEGKLLPESQMKLMRMRVRVVYDAGRDEGVKTFVQQAELLSYLAGIGDQREKLIRFAYYMEALVAYHRFLGGKEN